MPATVPARPWAPSDAVSRMLSGRPLSSVPPAGPAGAIVAKRRPAGWGDWSPRSSTVRGACEASMARTSAGSAVGVTEAAIALRTPRAWVTVPTAPGPSGLDRSARTSAPAL